MPETKGISLTQASGATVSLPEALDAGAAAFRGAYVHVPFCRHKCHYCDFYSFVDGEGRQRAFVDRAKRELEVWSPRVKAPLETLFVGGGTPTMLAPAELGDLLSAIRAVFPWREIGRAHV